VDRPITEKLPRPTDTNLISASRYLGATALEIFKGIVFPASLPYVFTGVRLAWGISLILIAAEMVGATVGMGYMVLEPQQTFRLRRHLCAVQARQTRLVVAAALMAKDPPLKQMRTHRSAT
jgi:ABC-type nitrate/sulfonate/bicarbonate transport system permease component